MAKSENTTPTQKKKRTSSAKTGSKVTVQSLQNDIANLELLLRDREAFIDSLISRTGDQESYILARDEYINSLSMEIERLKQYSELQEKASHERDQFVEQQEKALQERDQFIEQQEKALHERELFIEQLEKTIEERDRFIEHAEEKQHHDWQANNANDQFSHIVTKLTGSIDELMLSMHNQRQSEQSVTELTERYQQDLHAAQQQIQESSANIFALEQQLLERDRWGENASTRLNQLVNELNRIQTSSSWRITAPLRLSLSLSRLAVRRLIRLLKLPYKLIMKIGWRVAPKLFHRIYHQPVVQKILAPKAPPIIPAQPPANRETTASPEQAAINPANTTKITDTSTANWQLGERIDGPVNK